MFRYLNIKKEHYKQELDVPENGGPCLVSRLLRARGNQDELPGAELLQPAGELLRRLSPCHLVIGEGLPHGVSWQTSPLSLGPTSTCGLPMLLEINPISVVQ